MKQIPIIHLHIPKAAGSTLTRMLLQNFERDEVFICGDNEQGLDHYQSNIHFINLDDTEKLKYKFIAGHVEFALAQNYPAHHFLFTFLRNPISRINSLYSYIKQNPRHHMHHMIVHNNMSIESFCKQDSWHEIDNGMCRRISGAAASIPYGECTDAILDHALFNLEKNISFIGIHERFNESLFLLLHSLNALDLLEYERINTTKKKRQDTQLSPDAIDVITRYNQYDLALYSRARELYMARNEEQITALQKPLSRFLSAMKLKQAH